MSLAANTDLPVIGFLILNRNGCEWIAPLYESLKRQNYPWLKIYLVDNDSTDDSVYFTQTKYPQVKIIHFSKNVGYSIAYNRAMPYAFADGCDWVVWGNNDILLEPNCLLELGKMALKYSDIGVIGPAFYAWESNEPNYYMKGKHPDAIEPMQSGSTKPFDVDWVEGSFLMVSKKCIKNVGWLDPYLFFYWEEADFCRRARRKGWRVVIAPRAIARHYAGGSADQQNKIFANHLKLRNQYIYTLTDPNFAFLYNLISGLHLFLVLIKQAFQYSASSFLYELKAFLNVFSEIKGIYGKWRRDKNGITPPPTTPEYGHVTVHQINGAAS